MFRRIGWQMLLVGAGFLLTALILAYMATTYTTEFRPANGGTYIESVGGYPQSLNPLLSFYNDADSDVVALVFSGLTRIGMSGAVEPDLATGWDIDPSGITYTFSLNTGVLWHDGFYFTADDVLFTVNLLQDPDYPGRPDIGALWRSVEASKLNDYTVRFVLQEPYAPFLDYTTVGLLPKHRLNDIRAADLPNLEFNRQPIGTGPFRLTEVQTEQGQVTMLTFKRFPRYYGPEPYLENIILRFYPTARAAFEAYQDGVVEGVSRITLDILPQAFANENLKLHSAETSEMVMLYFNGLVTDTLPFDNTQVRQALFYALDRQAIVDTVLMGQAIIPQTPLLPGTWAYDTTNVPTYAYNPQQALDVLNQAGWRRTTTGEPLRNAQGIPLVFSLMASNDEQDLAVAREIVRQWARIGVSTTVQAVPSLALSGLLESRSYEAALVHLILPGDPDPYTLWHETQALPGQGQNYTGFQNRRISEIIEQARITVNPNQRLALYQEYQQLFMTEVPALPLFVPVYTYAIDVRVNGDQMGPLMRTGDRFRTIADWYVLQRRVVASLQQQ